MTSSNCRYPEISVPGEGVIGENSLVAVANVVNALKSHGVSPELIKEFRREALSADYRHVTATCAEWVHLV